MRPVRAVEAGPGARGRLPGTDATPEGPPCCHPAYSVTEQYFLNVKRPSAAVGAAAELPDAVIMANLPSMLVAATLVW